MVAVSKVAILTNVIPNYRQAFYKRLLQNNSMKVTIYCQNELKGFNLSLCHDQFPEHTRVISVCSLARERLAWQFLPIRQILKDHDCFIFYGNPKVLSNVVWSCLFKLAGKKVALWGQAHTAGAVPIREALRFFWWRLFDNLFVYSDAEVDYLQCRGIRGCNIVGMNNGLDQKKIEREKKQWPAEKLAAWQQLNYITDKTVMLSCARLDPKNQFYRVIEILPELIKIYPDLLWCVIGSGKEASVLKNQAIKQGVDHYIHWIGALYDECELAPWFLSAKLMIHPAAIGLSLLHAFGYGLPVVTHDNPLHHMPEFSVMENGKTGYLYQEGNMEAFQSVVNQALADWETLEQMGCAGLTVVQKKHNVDIMVARFSKMIEAMD